MPFAVASGRETVVRKTLFAGQLQVGRGGFAVESGDAIESAKQWLKDHPQDQARWLEGVTTFDGKPAAANLQLTRK